MCFPLLGMFYKVLKLLNALKTLRNLESQELILWFDLQILNVIWESRSYSSNLFFSSHAQSNHWLCTMAKTQRKLQQS